MEFRKKYGRIPKRNCKQVMTDIPKFIDNTLEVPELIAFMNHVDACPECMEELSIQFLVIVGLQRLEQNKDFNLEKELQDTIVLRRRRISRCKVLRHSILFLLLFFAAVLTAVLTLWIWGIIL